MNSVNFKNVSFIVLFLLVLGVLFGVVYTVGTFDSSSMYTQLFYGTNKQIFIYFLMF